MVGRVRALPWRRLAVAAPGVLLALGLGVALALSTAGRSPIWPDHAVNLSEAIAASEDAEVLRLMGSRLDREYDVRPGLLAEHAMRVTPLESAVLSRRADYLERLLGSETVLDAATWNRLRCLATDDAAALLDRHRPPGTALKCDESERR